MSQKKSSVDQMNEYFLEINGQPVSEHIKVEEHSLSEKESAPPLLAQLADANKSVTRKKLIASLIQQLETEQDVTKADLYRNTLEIILMPRLDE